GPQLLWHLVQQKNFFEVLKKRVDEKDPYAQFAMAGLFALQYYNAIFESDAFKMLSEAASKRNVPAINELGLCYYSGNMVKQDKQKAIEIWKKAASELKSEAAAVRIAIANIQDNFIYEEPGTSFQTLENASVNGSLLAQMALARCYEKGIIVSENISKAVRLYRLCAQRGSQGASRALKDLYDQIRPGDEMFRIIQ
ncbi:MAG: tetratricopeptide repeat protein, partial [Syntrophothermus sp.]